MHHLDHHERVAVTDAPRILGEVRDQLGGKPGGREGLHEGGGIGARERRHRQSHQLAGLVELVQGLSKETDVGHLLLADRGHQQERELVQPAPEEGQEPDAHLVGPVDVLQHHEQWLPAGRGA